MILFDKLKATEPARWAELARAVMVALVSVGWVTIGDAAVNSIASVVAVAVSVFLSEKTRKNVTPTGKLDNPAH